MVTSYNYIHLYNLFGFLYIQGIRLIPLEDEKFLIRYSIYSLKSKVYSALSGSV